MNSILQYRMLHPEIKADISMSKISPVWYLCRTPPKVTIIMINIFILPFYDLQDCVRNKAIMSVLMVREMTREEAGSVVDRVFDRCYNDLEPLGRRPRGAPREMEKARSEAYLYGYTDWTDKDH